MKMNLRYFVLVTLFFSIPTLASDQCKVDQLKLTRIKTVHPAGTMDDIGRAAIKEVIVSAAMYPVGMQLKAYKAVSKLNYVKGVAAEKVVQKVATSIPGVDSALDDLADAIGNAADSEDDLIVRINGVKVVPADYSETYQEMGKNATLDGDTLGSDQLERAVASIYGLGSVQLIEYDWGSVNDDLGSFEVQDEIPLKGGSNLDPDYFVDNEDKITVYATEDEDGSIYEVSYVIFPGKGNLNDIPERLFCDTDTCISARDPFPNDYRGITGISFFDEYEEIIECPSAYSNAGLFIADGEIWRVCEFKTPDCGFNFTELDDLGGVESLKDNDIIVLRGLVPHKIEMPLGFATWSKYIGDSDNKGQYLASCIGCTIPVLPQLIFAVKPHVMDPDRSAAQWRVRKMENGKIALQSDLGTFLARCEGCSSGENEYDLAFMHVTNPNVAAAQFTIAPSPSGEPNRYSLKADTGAYLTPCLGSRCLPDPERFGEAASASFHIFNANDPLTEWEVSVRQSTPLALPLFAPESEDGLTPQGTIDESINVPPSQKWIIAPGEVLTITRNTMLTAGDSTIIENNGTIINEGTILVSKYGELVNNGLIVNRASIRVRKGTLTNNAGAVIDHARGYELSNQEGSFSNNGAIYAPYGKVYGSNPTGNSPILGHYMGSGDFGELACSTLTSGAEVAWDAATSTCSVDNGFLQGGYKLYISPGAQLLITGSFTNSGTLINDGRIDNTNGLLRQCNPSDPPGPPSGNGVLTQPLNIEQPCIKPDAQVLCEAYNGPDSFNPSTSFCSAGMGPDFPIEADDEVVITSGITWSVGWLINSGTITVEEGGALVVSGLIENGEQAYINNLGTLSIEVDDGSGIPGTIENQGLINNFGILSNDGNIVGFGYVENKCGSTFTQLSNFQPPYNPEGRDHEIEYDCASEDPDWDDDNVNNEDDAFPYDNAETVDTDGDGVGDNSDDFPLNPDESIDWDGDCGVINVQTETSGTGCGDNSDAFPRDAGEQVDSDGDGVGDNGDLFPLNRNENADDDTDCGEIAVQTETSGDGCGNNSDRFPNNPAETSDMDGDNVGDNTDAYPYDPENTRTISVNGSNGWALATARFLSVRSVATPAPEELAFPEGLVQATLTGGNIGSTAMITITYPQPLRPDMKWWKYGRTADNNQPHWYAFENAVISGNTMVLTITDGGRGDDDGEANGEIIDPGGLALPQDMFSDGFEVVVPD